MESMNLIDTLITNGTMTLLTALRTLDYDVTSDSHSQPLACGKLEKGRMKA